MSRRSARRAGRAAGAGQRRCRHPAAALACVVALSGPVCLGVAGCSSGAPDGSGARHGTASDPHASQPAGGRPSPSDQGTAGSTHRRAPGHSRPAPRPSGRSYAPVGTGYAPYVSATAAAPSDSAGSPDVYNLAFANSRGGCTPGWAGRAIDDAGVRSRIGRLKDSGAAVRVSFGGLGGREPATTCTRAGTLAAAYGRALDAAGAGRADFDIEAGVLADHRATELRSAAMALLQKQRGTQVTLTLPVMPHGFNSDSLAVLKSAARHGVDVSAVNIMTMNYGTYYGGDMGSYAEKAARAAQRQMKQVLRLSDTSAWRHLAVTAMIGQNDVRNETFTLRDADRLRSFARSEGLAWVSLWSTARDRQCDGHDGDTAAASTTCSGVTQPPGAFARALAG